jgi:tetratricopeptide (TPR) repeat protein
MRISLRPSLLVVCLSVAAAWPAGGQSTPGVQDGIVLMQQGRVAEARAIFESVLERDPQNQQAQDQEVAATERLALEQRGGNHMVEALQLLMDGQKAVPASARLAYDIGILEDEMQLYPEAAKALETAQQLHMDDPMLLYAMARVQMDAGQLEKAAQTMQQYLQQRPGDASAHFGLGRIYQIGMQFDKATAEFQESIRLQPVQSEAWYQLGDVALKQRQFEEALTDFGKTLERNPHHGGALAGSGEALFREKQYEKALDFLDRAIAVAPDYQTGHYYRGLTLARLGRKEESEKELATAASLADAENKKSATRYQLTRTTQP